MIFKKQYDFQKERKSLKSYNVVLSILEKVYVQKGYPFFLGIFCFLFDRFSIFFVLAFFSFLFIKKKDFFPFFKKKDFLPFFKKKDFFPFF